MFNDRVAVVTGAAKRVGRAIAEHLAERGADVVVHYRSPDSAPHADELCRSIRQLGRQCMTVQADLTDSEQVHAAFQKISERFGKIHLLVNNASSFEQSTWPTLDLDSLERSLAPNLKAPFLCV